MNSAPLEESVVCFDLDGEPISLPRSLITFRPIVHGLFLLNDAALLEKYPHTDRWQPITTELAAGQSLELALNLHIREQLAAPLQIGPMLFAETHFMTDNRENGWQLSRHYFLLLPDQDELADSADFIQANSTVAWQPLNELTRAEMQCGYDAMQVARNLLQRTGKEL